MIRALTLGFFVFALTAGQAAAACMGSMPSITHVGVQSTSSSGGLNRYRIVITVENLGSMSQPSNVVQTVDIYDAQAGTKLDARGIPPIGVGGTQHAYYDWMRSSDAAARSSTLLFRLHIKAGNTCNSRSSRTLTL
jgi:hypothetical protein